QPFRSYLPPRPPPISPLLPYTTLFRSLELAATRNPRQLEATVRGGPHAEPRMPAVVVVRHGEHRRDRSAPGGDDAPAERLAAHRSEEHTSELQSRENLVCRLLLE